MLKRLSISQFVIITSLTVDYADGLTVLTGETGAGKTILLDALGLMLGDPADVDAIRQGEEESQIGALFEVPQNHPVWDFLSQKELATKGTELDLKRTMGRSGKDEISINGKPIDLPLLKEIGSYLVEIHGQNANHSFLAPESQMSLLDAFGAYPPGILENVAKAWEDIGKIAQELEEEKNFLLVAEREKPVIERTVAALEKLDMQPGVYKTLTEELANLINIKGLCELFSSINSQLIAQSGVALSLSRVDRLLSTQKDPVLNKIKGQIKTALDQTREAIAEMQVLAPTYIDVDTSGIGKAEERLASLKAIAAERKVAPEEIFEHYEYLAARLKRIREAPAKIKDFDNKLIRANEVYRGHAKILSDERKKAAEKLSAAITAEMPGLKMLSAQVQIEVTEDPNARTARGFNTVLFTARMNPGMPFSPITKTASGGELSRLILAFKMILQQVQTVSTLVFDEVDSGIGGAAAAAVGSRIARLAETMQILVITHSPQVAARGHQHLHVSKKTDGASTKSVVETLTLDQRIHEVSRMLAGEALTDESLAAARTLIEEARSAVRERKSRSSASSSQMESDSLLA